MDYDSLIERLLDGTISEVEKTALEQYMSASPDAAREVHSLLEVERLLLETAQEEDIRSLAFRESVRSELKSSLGFTTPSPATSPFSPIQRQPSQPIGAFGRHWPNVLTVLLMGLAVVAVLLPDGSASPSAQQQVVVPPPLHKQEVQIKELPPATNTLAKQPDVEQRAQSKQQMVPKPQAVQPTRSVGSSHAAPLASASAKPEQSAAAPSPKKLFGTINPESSKEQQYKQAIDDAIQYLKAQENNKAAAAITAKQLALLHEKIAASQTARTYFETARQYANEAGIIETKGEIIGEYALFEQRMGNTGTARSLATESLNVLRTAHSSRLGIWESKLGAILR